MHKDYQMLFVCGQEMMVHCVVKLFVSEVHFYGGYDMFDLVIHIT